MRNNWTKLSVYIFWKFFGMRIRKRVFLVLRSIYFPRIYRKRPMFRLDVKICAQWLKEKKLVSLIYCHSLSRGDTLSYVLLVSTFFFLFSCLFFHFGSPSLWLWDNNYVFIISALAYKCFMQVLFSHFLLLT